MGVGGAGTNPAANYKQRFRGGFDYNVTNQVSNILIQYLYLMQLFKDFVVYKVD